jgi:hypothetical protein
MSAVPCSAAVLAVFQLLFSPRWIHQWQRRQERAGPTVVGVKKNGAGSMNAFSPSTSRCGI